jgi:hypothetical protein
LCAKPNFKPNSKTNSACVSNKKYGAGSIGNVLSLSCPDPLSLFWLTIEIILYSNNQKSPIHEI